MRTIAYIYIIVNFQLRSSIHAGLTECSLYNRFALKNLPKWGFGGIFGEGAKIFGDTINTLVYTRGKVITKNIKKRNVYAVRITFHPGAMCSAYPPKPLVTPWCTLGPMGDVMTHALFQLNRFRG